MNISLDMEIREKLASYFEGRISLEDFEDWFVSASWNVVQSKNRQLIDMVYDIELLLAEFTDGCWTQAELKQLLRPFIENYIIEPELSQIKKLSSTALQNYWLISPVSFHILHS